MKKWYALSTEGAIVFLGEHEDFESADSAISSPVWILDEEVAKDWLVSLLVFNHHHKWGVQQPQREVLV